MNVKNDKQVVTVAVITYHSSATVLETLDSIVNQTYGPRNIELIISDDGSKDCTVNLIEAWLLKYQNCFHNVKLFSNKVNGGISNNCNIAWKAATSKWIKTIAGDDVLLSNCIESNVTYVGSYDNSRSIGALFSNMQLFKIENNKQKLLRIGPDSSCRHIFDKSIKQQFKYLQKYGIQGAPSAFINRDALAAVGFADERFPMMEDHPLWFKMTKSNFKLAFMDELTVLYRITDSTSNSATKLLNEKYIREIIKVEDLLIIPSLKPRQKILKIRKHLWPRLSLMIAKVFNNKPSLISKSLLAIVLFIKPGFAKYQIYKVFN